MRKFILPATFAALASVTLMTPTAFATEGHDGYCHKHKSCGTTTTVEDTVPTTDEPTTTTVAPTTTVVATTVAPTSTTAVTTTTAHVETTVPVTVPVTTMAPSTTVAETVAPTTTVVKTLPKTGPNDTTLTILAIALIAGGLGYLIIRVSRRA